MDPPYMFHILRKQLENKSWIAAAAAANIIIDNKRIRSRGLVASVVFSVEYYYLWIFRRIEEYDNNPWIMGIQINYSLILYQIISGN